MLYYTILYRSSVVVNAWAVVETANPDAVRLFSLYIWFCGGHRLGVVMAYIRRLGLRSRLRLRLRKVAKSSDA